MRGDGTRSNTEVAIIGAGPYGLSIAAHLSELRVPYRIFGTPMGVWAKHMPEGMRLKSEGFASSLYDRRGEFTLGAYCRSAGLPYADMNQPVPLETFVAYGIAFQKRFVPHLEDTRVVAVRRREGGFELDIESGESLLARQVVVATGISHFAYTPPELSHLDDRFLSHSSDHNKLDGFRGKRVAVLGAGASAADLAALLHQAGATAHLIARSKAIRFHNPPPAHRSLKDRLLKPATGIGPGLRLAFFVKAPHVFRRFPESFRLRKVRDALGPAPGWFVKDDVVGKVPIHLGAQIRKVSVENNAVLLQWADANGQEVSLEVDHVIAATGFRVDLSRLIFIGPELRKSIVTTGGSPLLSASFESSVPGLYFVGLSAANTFGPLMRFAYGAGFTSGRVSRALAKKVRRTGTSALDGAAVQPGSAEAVGGRPEKA